MASLSMSGNMCCRAYVHQKATVKEAIQVPRRSCIMVEATTMKLYSLINLCRNVSACLDFMNKANFNPSAFYADMESRHK